MNTRLRNFFCKPAVPFALWLILAVVAALTKAHKCNNFIIFRSVFHHMRQMLPLYDAYPAEYYDLNHYGVLFGIVVAPFAVLPVLPSLVLWCVVLALSLYCAVRILPACSRGEAYMRLFVYYFCAHELLTALFMQQFNVAVVAIMVAAFALVERERDEWATALIMLGAFVKIYTIVGLVFFLFSRHKLRFVLSSVIWTAVMLVLPMLFTSVPYVLGMYVDWMEDLFLKNSDNSQAFMQDISAHGLLTRALGFDVPYLPVLAVGALLFLLPLLRIGQWRHLAFRYTVLANALLFIVLFSSGTESSGYIIALVGVVLWYVTSPWLRRGWWSVALLVFVFILTSMSPSDLFPPVAKVFVQQHALKALPCLIVFGVLVYEQLTCDYADRAPIAAR